MLAELSGEAPERAREARALPETVWRHFLYSYLEGKTAPFDPRRVVDVSFPTINFIALGDVAAAVSAAFPLVRSCFPRGPFNCSLRNVHGANNKKLTLRARDLIQNFAHRRRRSCECKIDNRPLDRSGRALAGPAGLRAVLALPPFLRSHALQRGIASTRRRSKFREAIQLARAPVQATPPRPRWPAAWLRFIEPKMKILRQFHPVGPRSFGDVDNRLAQARLKLIRRIPGTGRTCAFSSSFNLVRVAP